MFTPKWDTLKPSEKSVTSPETASSAETPGSGNQGLVPSVDNPIETRRSLESLLSEPYLAVSRRIELANLLVGFEQANHYTLYNRHGQIVGYLAEDNSIAKTFIRNIARTHRPFSAAVFDPQGNILLRIQRPFYWITSSLFVQTAHHEPIGEIHTNWHLWRRRYSLYSDRNQFASIDAPWLSWEFTLVDEQGRILVNHPVTPRRWALRLDFNAPNSGAGRSGSLMRARRNCERAGMRAGSSPGDCPGFQGLQAAAPAPGASL